MDVRVRIQFKHPTEDDWGSMRSLANSLTEEPNSVKVSADENPEWLVVEFTMPTEAQYRALPKIERAIRLHAENRWDSTFNFPLTEAERARNKRKTERRKSRRRGT